MGGGDRPFIDVRLQVSVYSAFNRVGGWVGGGDRPFIDVRLLVSVYSAVLLSTELVGGWVRGGWGWGWGQSIYRCPLTELCCFQSSWWVGGCGGWGGGESIYKCPLTELHCFQSSWWVGGCVGRGGNNPFAGVRLQVTVYSCPFTALCCFRPSWRTNRENPPIFLILIRSTVLNMVMSKYIARDSINMNAQCAEKQTRRFVTMIYLLI